MRGAGLKKKKSMESGRGLTLVNLFLDVALGGERELVREAKGGRIIRERGDEEVWGRKKRG